MSRIGQMPIPIPGGVDVQVGEGEVTVKGPKGTLTKSIHPDMIVKIEDGDMRRDGWYVQGSWRVSFGKLLADRYFRSIEPLVRYGTFRVDVPLGPSPTLPGTWDRKALTLAGIIEVTGDVFVKVEYTFHDEQTGDRPIDNDELLVELLLQF